MEAPFTYPHVIPDLSFFLRIVHLKMKILLSFTYIYSLFQTHETFLSFKNKLRCFNYCWEVSVPLLKVQVTKI